MTAYGVDEAWGKLTVEQLKAAGKSFVIGYVSEDETKNLTRDQVAAYHAGGIAVLLVYEYSVTAVHGGKRAGMNDAFVACQQAKAMGYPQGCALAFAVDEDTSGNPSVVDDYARAFTNVCYANGYRSMVYGGLSTVIRCHTYSLTDMFWQTYAWSNGQWGTFIDIRQVQNGVTIAGVDVDLDIAMVEDFGAWMPGGNEMLKLFIAARETGKTAVTDIVIGNGVTARHVVSDADWQALQNMWWWEMGGKEANIGLTVNEGWTTDGVAALGVDVGTHWDVVQVTAAEIAQQIIAQLGK